MYLTNNTITGYLSNGFPIETVKKYLELGYGLTELDV